MRLTPEQLRIILQTVRQQAGESAKAYLFGSRLDDQARGGDVDLLIETPEHLSLMGRARLKMTLESRLGLPVDVLVHNITTDPTPFQQIARARALPLESPQ